MHRGTKYALIPAAIPAVALTAALPFVNRIEPTVLGFPFLLFWISAWVAATPACLWLAYLVERRSGRAAGSADRSGR